MLLAFVGFALGSAIIVTVGAVVSAVILLPEFAFTPTAVLLPTASYTSPLYPVIAISPLSPAVIGYVYVILVLFALIEPNVAVLC